MQKALHRQHRIDDKQAGSLNLRMSPDYTAKNSSSIGLFLPPQVIGAGAGKCWTWLLIDPAELVHRSLSIARP